MLLDTGAARDDKVGVVGPMHHRLPEPDRVALHDTPARLLGLPG